MEIKNLQARQTNVDIQLDVTEVGETRQFEKFGKPGRVATAQAKDSAGDSIKLTLWNEDIDKVKAGDKIELKNGYVSEWQGELQLTTGKFGSFEVIGKSDVQEGEVSKDSPPEDDKDALDKPDIDEESVEGI